MARLPIAPPATPAPGRPGARIRSAHAAQPHRASRFAGRALRGAAFATALALFVGRAAAAGPRLGLDTLPEPVAARYAVSVAAPAGTRTSPVLRAQWTFVREHDRIALLRGSVDDIWSRDTQGRVSLERVFHADRAIAEYRTGELAALGVRADWAALARFVDPLELRALVPDSRAGRGPADRVRLRAAAGAQGSLYVEWLPALQLPALMVRRAPDGSTVRIELKQHAAARPAAWPEPGFGITDYARIDAADFGDMAYEPVVMKAESLDARNGWRPTHPAH